MCEVMLFDGSINGVLVLLLYCVGFLLVFKEMEIK